MSDFNPTKTFHFATQAEVYLQQHGFVYEAVHMVFQRGTNAYVVSQGVGDACGNGKFYMQHMTEAQLEVRARTYERRKHHHCLAEQGEYSCTPLESLLFKIG